jgi:uncharacterized protein (DUF1330 family)
MPKAYWVICHRSTNNAEKFAAFTKLAYPAIHADLAKAMAAYDTPDYRQALRALANGAERDVRIVEGV